MSNPKAFSDRVNATFINVVRTVPGFISYTGIEESSGSWASMSLFVSKEGVVQSDRLAAEWVKQYAADLVFGPPEITEGPVGVR